MATDLSQIHINRALDSMSVMLNSDPDTFLVGRICARRPVDALSDNFFVYDRSGASHSPTAGQSSVKFLPNVTEDGAEAPLIDQGMGSLGTYQCRRYAYRDFVSDKAILIADDPLNPIKDAGIMMAQRVRNDIEGIGAAIIAAYGSYPASNRVQLTTGANGTSWNKASAAGTGSKPLDNIKTAKIVVETSIQMPANFIAMSARTKYELNDHDTLKGILQYTDDTYLVGEGIPDTLRSLRISVGHAVWNTAAEGAAFSGDYIFGDQTEATATNQPCAIIGYVPDDRSIGPRGFSSYIWFDAPDETTRTRGISLRAYRDENKRGYFVEAAQTADIQPGIVDGSSKITGAYMISRAAIP
jgi:hypothetical protein